MIQQALNQALSTGLAGAYIYSQTPHYKGRVEKKSLERENKALNTVLDMNISDARLEQTINQINANEAEIARINLNQHPESAKAQDRYASAVAEQDYVQNKNAAQRLAEQEEKERNAAIQEKQREAAASEQAALDRYYSRANGQMVQAQSLQERLALLRESAKKGAN